MKIAVVGDTHGKIDTIVQELREIEVDHLFFTGDFYSDAGKISRRLGLDFTGVSGNCDFRSKGEQEQFLRISGKHFYITHGHKYGVKHGLNSLYYRAEEIKADVVLFGHTHIPFCEKINGIWFINPGSPSRPRGGARKTYALIEIENHSFSPQIIYLAV